MEHTTRLADRCHPSACFINRNAYSNINDNATASLYRYLNIDIHQADLVRPIQIIRTDHTKQSPICTLYAFNILPYPPPSRGLAESPPATSGKPPTERTKRLPVPRASCISTRISRTRQPVQIEISGCLPGNVGTGGHRINERIDYMPRRHLHPANITRPTTSKRSRVRMSTVFFWFAGCGACVFVERCFVPVQLWAQCREEVSSPRG
jgi:hypothetical protein